MTQPSTHVPRVATVNIQHNQQSFEFRLFDTPLSRLICSEVLSGQSYPLVPFEGQIHNIVDIGANIGAASVYFALHYPNARIFAFEPDPSSFELLVLNTTSLSGVSTFNLGLMDRNGQLPLFKGNQDSVTNSTGNSCLNSGDHVVVPIRDAGQLISEQELNVIDILKLDTEGSEVPILQSLSAMLPEIAVIYLEYHDDADRRVIDQMLAPTHLLWRGKCDSPHRGELCYVLSRRAPNGTSQLRITPSL
jgi:FkbM family methyltransferase